MTAFLIAAALLTLGGLLFVLWPLLRPASRARTTAQAASLSIYRDQFAELERDLKLGTLDSAQYDNARAELERRLLDEVAAQAPDAGAARRTGCGLAVLIAVVMPVCAGLLYWHLGRPSGIGAPKHTVADASNITRADFEAMTSKLAQRMAANPDDPVGWLMLGRAYKALERYPEAAQALQEADRRKPNEPEILAEYAEALALQRGRDLDGEPDASARTRPQDRPESSESSDIGRRRRLRGEGLQATPSSTGSGCSRRCPRIPSWRRRSRPGLPRRASWRG